MNSLSSFRKLSLLTEVATSPCPMGTGSSPESDLRPCSGLVLAPRPEDEQCVTS